MSDTAKEYPLPWSIGDNFNMTTKNRRVWIQDAIRRVVYIEDSCPQIEQDQRKRLEMLVSMANASPAHAERFDAAGLPSLQSELAECRRERDALAKFKAYVHKRLDDAGIPADPESPHKAEGCRIGGRLDIALAPSPGVSAEELAEREADAKVIAAAPAGPWRECGAARDGCICGQVWSTSLDKPILTAFSHDEECGSVSVEVTKAVAAFAARARTRYPSLLQQLTAAESDRDKANNGLTNCVKELTRTTVQLGNVERDLAAARAEVHYGRRDTP